MGIIVQKFGGSSVADTEKLWNVCKHIQRELEQKNDVVVVVSAQRENNRQIDSEKNRKLLYILKKENTIVLFQ